MKYLSDYATYSYSIKCFFEKNLAMMYSQDHINFSVERVYENELCFFVELLVDSKYKPTFIILRNEYKHHEYHRDFHEIGNVYLYSVTWENLRGNIF